MQNRAYKDLFNLVKSLCGIGSFAASEQDDIANLINRRFFEAYQTTSTWTRYLVVGEERTISNQVVPYTEASKDDIGEFIKVTKTRPLFNSSALDYTFFVTGAGAQIINASSNDSSTVFVTYKKSFTPFTTSSGYTTSTESVPAEFFHYVAHTAYADFLRMDGQTDKALVEEQNGENYLFSELESAGMVANGNLISTKFSTHLNRQSRNI
jgi:hypothetical protein